MADENGISAIATSPLGSYGLNMSGAYSSYPSMMSMTGLNQYGMGYGSLFGNGMGMGYMGMYSPEYMMQFANAQNQMEINQLQQAQLMNQLMTDGRVNASIHADKAFAKTVLQNGSVKNLMSRLIDGVRNKDLENICSSFDALKKQIIATYSDEISARGDKENVNLAAIELIESLYTTEVNAQMGRQNANLRDDIMSIGENAFINGYKCSMRPGHSTRDLKSTMNHCFGTEITEIEHDKSQKELGKVAGRVAHGFTTGAKAGIITVGGGIGAAALIQGLTLGKFKFGPIAKFMGKAGIVGACAATIIDLISPGAISNLLGIISKQKATT